MPDVFLEHIWNQICNCLHTWHSIILWHKCGKFLVNSIILNLNLILDAHGSCNRGPHLHNWICRVGIIWLRMLLIWNQSLVDNLHATPNLLDFAQNPVVVVNAAWLFGRAIEAVVLLIRNGQLWKHGRHVWTAYAIKVVDLLLPKSRHILQVGAELRHILHCTQKSSSWEQASRHVIVWGQWRRLVKNNATLVLPSRAFEGSAWLGFLVRVWLLMRI